MKGCEKGKTQYRSIVPIEARGKGAKSRESAINGGWDICCKVAKLLEETERDSGMLTQFMLGVSDAASIAFPPSPSDEDETPVASDDVSKFLKDAEFRVKFITSGEFRMFINCLLMVGKLALRGNTALEAVTIVLDIPPPQPGSMLGFTSVDRVSASDPNCQVWFLRENVNYAASEYAWESATPPGTALIMLDADKMVIVASSRNPTLAGALTRLQRCAFSGSWEV
ncbi:hypothetical protein COLO4_38524 [Corchorus olitorius]|uniref:Uncharacterized protein n=1 Tax=Corchorus olitorius TaxID=93759 RepID=A0A1R3FUF9_9ROSI|nr:hypothetical protein COLO4_38524 [Corchorus olitorius]